MWQHVHKCCRLVGDTSDYLITEVLWKLKQYARIYNIEKNECMNITANTANKQQWVEEKENTVYVATSY